MKKENSFWQRLSKACDILHLLLIIGAGAAGAYLLGHVFGLGTQGYVIGFIIGVAAAAFGAL